MIQPLHDRLLVERLPVPQGAPKIVIPEIAQELANYGRILAVGPGKRVEGERLPLSVKVGDRVYFGPYNDWQSIAMGLHFEEWVLIQEADIRVVVDG